MPPQLADMAVTTADWAILDLPSGRQHPVVSLQAASAPNMASCHVALLSVAPGLCFKSILGQKYWAILGLNQ